MESRLPHHRSGELGIRRRGDLVEVSVETQKRQTYWSQGTPACPGLPARTACDPHGPSSSSIMPLSCRALANLSMIFDSCGPYLGGLQQIGAASPVSMRQEKPRMLRRRPALAKTSQYFLIMSNIAGLYSFGTVYPSDVSIDLRLVPD